MVKRIFQLFFLVVGVTLGWQYGERIFELIHLPLFSWDKIVTAILGGMIALAIAALFSAPFVMWFRWLEDRLIKTPLVDLVSGVIGFVLGLFIAFLLTPAIGSIPVVGIYVQFFASILLAYLGFRIFFSRREEIFSFIPGLLARSKDREKDRSGKASAAAEKKVGDAKILDTSVIIDGRIADIVQTGFLDGVIVIPSFVPKIMRPADVCNTLVTITSIRCPICSRPPSITIIVPSSRYAIPCPNSLPSLMTLTIKTSPGKTTGFTALARSLMLSTSTPCNSHAWLAVRRTDF